MIKRDEIEKALSKITSLIEIQAEDGSQTKEVQKLEGDLYSLGQFIGDQPRDQRGIHGTSSGLLVLAEQDSNNSVIRGFIKYLENHTQIESKLQEIKGDVKEDRLERDENNIIKISEILIALSHIKQAQASSEKFGKELANKLIESLYRQSGIIGWNYFLNINHEAPPDLLPSGFAILALAKHGYKEIDEPLKSLQERLINEEINDPSRLAVFTFCLYAIINSIKDPNQEQVKNFKTIIDKIWSSPYCSLQNDYEQNLEYWYNSQHDYVRIPWQMYLLTISISYAKFNFYTVNCQNRLNDMIKQAKHTGFKYPYSGPYISTRTNAILFECLNIIKDNLKGNIFYYLLVKFDWFRQILSSKIFKFFIRLGGLFLLSYVIYLWKTDPNHRFSDVAPELLAYIIITLLGKKNEVH